MTIFPRRPPLACFTALSLALLLVAPPGQATEADEVRTLLARGDHTQALARAQQAADAHPRDAQARFLLGVVLMESGRDGPALELFTQMSELYPELPDTYNNIALLQVRAGRLEAARQALDTALRNDPSHRTARANLGQVHLMLAVQAWEQAAAAGPLDVALQRKLEVARSLLASQALGAR